LAFGLLERFLGSSIRMNLSPGVMTSEARHLLFDLSIGKADASSGSRPPRHDTTKTLFHGAE
jgi:hypothetical protein